jgi:hypothetical protein
MGFTVAACASKNEEKRAQPGARANGPERPWLILNVRQKMKPIRLITIGFTALLIGVLLTLFTPARRSADQVERDAASGRFERGTRFDRNVMIQHIIFDAIAVLGVGLLIVGFRRSVLAQKRA